MAKPRSNCLRLLGLTLFLVGLGLQAAGGDGLLLSLPGRQIRVTQTRQKPRRMSVHIMVICIGYRRPAEAGAQSQLAHLGGEVE